MLKFVKHLNNRTGFGRSNEELVSTEYDVSPSPAHTKYSDQPQERSDNSFYSRFHSNSLKSLNTAGQSLKQKLSRKTKTLFNKYSSRSLECVLGESESSKALTSNYLSPTQKSSTVQRFSSEIEDMALLRRVESERRGPISEPRIGGSPLRLPHAQSIDGGLNQPPFYRDVHLSNTFPENLGAHRRSMSQRELSRPPSMEGGIIDAFGFVSTNGHTSDFSSPVSYSSAANLHFDMSRNQRTSLQYHRPPEVPISNGCQPMTAARGDARMHRPSQVNYKPSGHNASSLTPDPLPPQHKHTEQMDKENFYKHRKVFPPHSYIPQGMITPNSSSRVSRQASFSAPVTNKQSIAPKVRRVESVKRRLQSNKKAATGGGGGGKISSGNPQPHQSHGESSPREGNEVISEKGRSVKSIVGMFDQPAIHQALANARLKQENGSLMEEVESVGPETGSVSEDQMASRSDRSATQVVHIAKFIQIEDCSAKPPVNYTDAQTSPMQLSPTDQSQSRNSPSLSSSSGARIAKAETFSGGPRPKLAIMTSSSTSSYVSNDVFTPPTERMDSPVFDVPVESAYPARADGGSRGFYHGDRAADSVTPNVPSGYQPYSQHLHLSKQILRQQLAEGEAANHYEDLEGVQPSNSNSAREMENIYEPISPVPGEPCYGNYMNIPSSTPSNEFVEMGMHHNLSDRRIDRRSFEGDHHRGLSMDSALTRSFSVVNGDRDFNASHEEENYSHQVREASHRTLRQTSIENGNKLKTSPTREEITPNKYSARVNVNPVLPTHRSQNSAHSAPPLGKAQSLQSPYTSQSNLSERTDEFVKMRNKPMRTDSCRVQPRAKNIDRTSSYRAQRNSLIETRGGLDNQRVIRDNLIDFCKRKSRDCSIDNTEHMSNVNGNNTSPHSTHLHQSPSKPSLPNVPMHWAHSERSFTTNHNIPNSRASNVDRAPSMKMGDVKGTVSSAPPSYMHSWDASSIANRSLPSPLESPRVRKPLVAEVSPFSMPNPSRNERPAHLEVGSHSRASFRLPTTNKAPEEACESRLGFYNKLMRRRSSIGSAVLKSAKTGSADSQDSAPSLPPRNYHPDDVHSTDHRQTNSEQDLGKPYQNLFNGATKVSDNDFDAGYTAQLRRVSKHQYVRSSPEGAKTAPAVVPPSRLNSQQSPASPHHPTPPGNQGITHHSPSGSAHSNVTQSPHSYNTDSSSHSPAVVSPHTHSAKFVTPPHHLPGSVAPQHSGSKQAASVYTPPESMPKLQTGSRSSISHNTHQVLETDIDEPSSPDVQPPPPPRRQSKDQISNKPPPKPPKLLPTIHNSEINHNEAVKGFPHHSENPRIPSASKPAAYVGSRGLVEPAPRPAKPLEPEPNTNTDYTPQYSPKLSSHRVEGRDEAPPTFSPAQSKEQLNHSRENLVVPPKPLERKDRRSESLTVSPRGEDMTVTSGDLSANITRKHSLHKQRQSRRSYSSSSIHKEERALPDSKYSPTGKLSQRETEFSAIEKATPTPAHRLDPHLVNNVIHENRPKPFDRYLPGSTPTSASHSRQPSAEILNISSRTESPAHQVRQRDEVSPTLPPRTPPRSPKHSPVASRSTRASFASLSGDSRKSTPSPQSAASDAKYTAKSDPSTPVDKSFIPISKEIIAELAGQGIDITGKHKCISDESKARLVKLKTLNDSSTPVKRKPTVRHIRQKSADEILCDTQVEHLGRSIKDDTLSQVLSKPQKGTTDYLPGIFDDVLSRDVPRKQRQSVGSSPCHSTQSSDGDGSNMKLVSKPSSPQPSVSPFDELNTVQERKEEIVLVLKRKLSVLNEDQTFRRLEIEDNGASGDKVAEIVASKCTDRELSKYKSYIDDVEKITKLLLKLSRRLARAENELRNAPMDATDDDKKSLEQKRNNLQQQHNDAKSLKESIDKRKVPIVGFLRRALDETEFEQFDHFVSIKLKLIMELSDIEDQITHCEEQIAAVTAISS